MWWGQPVFQIAKKNICGRRILRMGGACFPEGGIMAYLLSSRVGEPTAARTLHHTHQPPLPFPLPPPHSPDPNPAPAEPAATSFDNRPQRRRWTAACFVLFRLSGTGWGWRSAMITSRMSCQPLPPHVSQRQHLPLRTAACTVLFEPPRGTDRA